MEVRSNTTSVSLYPSVYLRTNQPDNGRAKNSKTPIKLMMGVVAVSGHQDSNLGPPAPKAGTLTGLRYAPSAHLKIDERGNCGGDGGIRTRGTR